MSCSRRSTSRASGTSPTRRGPLPLIETGGRAAKELRDTPDDAQKRLRRALKDLETDPWPANLDICTLTGYSPWMRCRVGDHRILLRPMTDAELVILEVDLPREGFLVARVVHKRYARRAIRGLPR